MFDDTDQDWEEFGAKDPYFGVITDDKYHKDNLTDEAVEVFFRSGHIYIADILSKVRKHIDPTFTPKKSLDFGCGVGRLIVPLAGVSESVTGVDVSESALNEARRICELRSVKNVIFIKSNDNLSSLSGTYDFIHSFIVFQHILVKRGIYILKNLLAHAEKGCVCVLHFTYATQHYRKHKISSWIKSYIPLGKNLINWVKGRKFYAPTMQMNLYDLNKIFLMMQEIHVHDFYAEYTDHGGYFGLLVYFRVEKDDI